MSPIKAIVEEVHTEPYEGYGRWWVKVKYNCYSVKSKTLLMFETKEEAEKVKIGYKFYN